jgi:hypothetical protein
MSDYVPPKYEESAFNCPHCGAYSRQEWRMRIFADNRLIENLSIAVCDRCEKYSIWLDDKMIYPIKSTAPLPSTDTPENILEDYNEARNIFENSPRAAAALLRLAIQKLCVVLDEKGNNINKDIASLVSKGLSPDIQKALDTVRVVGNNAVHPGTIDLNDNPSIALSLFKLVNIIIDAMITQPKEINNLYDSLPKKAKEAIKKRDQK